MLTAAFEKNPEFTIYALRLENGKFYVGKTLKAMDARFAEHVSGSGAAWTKLHAPHAVEEQAKGDKYAEDALFAKYASKYGIQNVRGGAHCQIELSPDVIAVFSKHSQSVNDLCFKCNQPGHFAKQCSAVKINTNASTQNVVRRSYSGAKNCNVKQTRIQNGDNVALAKALISAANALTSRSVPVKNKTVERHFFPKGSCFKCGRTGHLSTACYAKKDINGIQL